MNKGLFCDEQKDETSTRRLFLKYLAAATGFVAPFKSSSALGGMGAAGNDSDAAHTAMAMAKASNNFLKSLFPQLRTLAALGFSGDQREDWHYIPKARKGVPYKRLDKSQTQLANVLLRTGLSEEGYQKASTIMSLEPILGEEEGGSGLARDPEFYYFCVFGEPGASKRWGWSVEGHHISLNYTVVNDSMLASTPAFLGAHPAEILHGPRQGLRTLAAEEDLARTLLKSLDDQQRNVAVLSGSAPADILSGHSRKANPIQPAGLQASRLSDKQADILTSLLTDYTRNMTSQIAAARTRKLQSAGFRNVHFAWAGGFEHGQPHYYRIQGPTFLVEYDNTQNGANPIYSVWRDFDGDFGADLLAEHYKQAHR
jgi:hypothetical protein